MLCERVTTGRETSSPLRSRASPRPPLYTVALPPVDCCCISGTSPNGSFTKASRLPTMLRFRRDSRLQTRLITLSPPWTMVSLTGSPPATKKHPPPRHNKFPDLRHHLPLHLRILCISPSPAPPVQIAQHTELSVLIPTDEPHRTSARTGENVVGGAQKIFISEETLIERLVGLSRIWALVLRGSNGPSFKKPNFKVQIKKVQHFIIYLMPLRPLKNGSPSRPLSKQAPENQQDSSFVICKTAELGWVFLGQVLESPIHGSLGQSYIRSLQITEGIATVRLILWLVLTLEFSTLKVFSNNSTLIRAIYGNIQSKEISGFLKDLRSISSGFAPSYFYRFSSSAIALVDFLAKKALQTFSSL